MQGKVPAEVGAALALRTTLARVDDARREEGRNAMSNSSRVVAAVDFATATDDEAAAMAEEQGLELAEHDDLAHAGASSYTGVTQASGRTAWRARVKRDSERLSLGNYRSATAAAVAVAQWERDHPSGDSARGVLGGFADPGESLTTTEDALRAIARALRVQSGASPPQTDDERPPTPLPDDFGTSSEDD